MNQGIIEVLDNEFKEAHQNLNLTVDYSEKREENFLKIKIAFTSFLGVIFIILFNHPEDFSENFLIIFLAITFFAFLLLISKIIFLINDADKAVNRNLKGLILRQIRYITAKESDPRLVDIFKEYSRKAEKMLFAEHVIYQKMKNEIIFEKIIEIEEDTWGKIEMFLWMALFLSVPILFLLKIMKLI